MPLRHAFSSRVAGSAIGLGSGMRLTRSSEMEGFRAARAKQADARRVGMRNLMVNAFLSLQDLRA